MASREVTENGAHHEVSLTETVSTIFQKRIRALKKKVRNVEEIEKKVQEGKTINEQQEEAIRNKNITLCMIEEVERLRSELLRGEPRGRESPTGTAHGHGGRMERSSSSGSVSGLCKLW